MPDASAKVRLFVESDLAAGAEVALAQPQAHYLFAVMRMGVGAAVRLFNGRDGEWIAEVAEAGRRGGRLICRERSRGQTRPRDLHLLFAPVKKARTDFIVEKACELGCAALRPVFTRFTNAERLRAPVDIKLPATGTAVVATGTAAAGACGRADSSSQRL